jgi:PAS domain S-box-containing protein
MKEPSRTNQELLIENSLLMQRIQELEHADTKRRLAEDAVLESNNLLKLIVNTMPQSVFWKDPNGRYLGCNTVFAAAVGINDPNQIVGKTDFDLPWPRKEALAYRTADRQVIESGQPKLHIIEPLQQSDGTRRLVDTSKVPLCDSAGRPFGVLGVYEDITERKRTEDALRESETTLRAVLDAAPFPVAMVDLQDDKISFWSHSAHLLFGHTAATSAGWYELAYPDPKYRQEVIERWKPFLEKARSSGQTVNTGEYRVSCCNGTVRICELHATFLADYLIVTFNDITELKQAEESLHQSAEKFTKAFETSHNAIIITRVTDGQFIEVNDAFTAITDYQREETLANSSIGLNLWVHEEDRQHVVDELRAGHVVIDREFLFRTKNGKIITGLFSAQIIHLSIGICILSSITDITERKKAEEISKQEQALSNAIIEAIPGTFYMLDEIGQYVRWNAYQRDEIVGKPDDQVGSTNALDTIHPDDRELIQSKIVNVLANGVDETIEGRVLLCGGPAFRWLLMTGRRMLIDGRPFLVGIGIDITERKQAEEELRVSEKDLKESQRIAHVGSWHLDVSTNQVVWSEELYKMYGFDSTKPVPSYTEHMKLFTNESWKLLSESLENTRQTGIPYELELRTVRFDGSNGWMWVRGEAIQDKNIQTIGLWGAAQDITARKQSEEALQESEEKFRSITEQTSDLIAITDTGGIVTYASSAAEKLFQFAPEEMCGRNFIEFLDESDIPRALAVFSDALKGDLGKHGVELSMKRKDGSIFIGELNGSIFQQGLMNGTLVVIRDITARKQAEEEIRLQNEQLHLLYKASQRLNQTLNRDDIHQVLCEFMSANTPNDGFVISDFDPETQLITCRAFWMDNKWLDVSVFPAIPLEAEGKGTQSIAIRSGQPMLIHDFQAQVKTARTSYFVNAEINEIESQVPAEDEEITRSALIVPLKLDNRVTGVIQVMSYHLNAFTENQLKLLQALALHISSAEQNALLFAQVQTELTERKQAEEKLLKKMDELERWQNLTVGRELKMIELKKEINALLEQAGKPQEYKIVDGT